MPVVQITYDLPFDIAKGLATGELRLLGTAAVRNGTNITAHIREVSRTLSDGDSAMNATLAKSLKDPKVIAVGLGVVVAVAGAGAAAGWMAGKKSKGIPEVAAPECVIVFNDSLSSYLEAVDNGAVDAAVIDSLISALDTLKAEAAEGNIAVDISIEQWDVLVGVVADYTSKLAEANAVELGALEGIATTLDTGRVVDLRRYLEAQRRIFDESA
ncbi:hypothetical protein AB4028_11510 [Janibacter sp. RAF20_2_2]|uniref:hypothetical protein n=1 Tax=unclassified Janibacter TaxID=2649294 RepID=UPI003F93C1B4